MRDIAEILDLYERSGILIWGDAELSSYITIPFKERRSRTPRSGEKTRSNRGTR